MPPSVSRAGRPLALAVSSILVAAVIGVPSSASALPPLEAELEVETSFNGGGVPTCELSDGGDSGTTVSVSNGVTRTKTIAVSGTYTDSADLSDVTQVEARASATARITMAGGSLKTYDFKASAATSSVAAQSASSECSAEASATALLSSFVAVSGPGWLDLEVTKARGGVMSMILVSAMEDSASQEVQFGARTHSTKTLFVPKAGFYIIVSQLLAETDAGDPDKRDSASASGSVHVEFTRAGGASSPARGKGKAYLKPGAVRACGSASLTSRWTSKAGKVASADFFVDERKVRTIRSPKAGKNVAVKGLRATKAVELVVVLRLKSGRTQDVSRSYRACK